MLEEKIADVTSRIENISNAVKDTDVRHQEALKTAKDEDLYLEKQDLRPKYEELESQYKNEGKKLIRIPIGLSQKEIKRDCN
jgi:cell division protein FtsL